MNDFQKNSKTALNYQLTVMSALCLLLLLFPVYLIVAAQKLSAFAILLYIISGILFLLIVTFTVINAIVSHKLYRYKIDENSIEVIKGFIFKKHIYQPKNKVREIYTVNKKFIYKNLCDLVFVNDAYNVTIKNLTKEEAGNLLKENFEGTYFNERI